MCTISGTCGCKGGTGTFLAALALRLLASLARWLLWTLQMLALALIVAGKWAAPRLWRATVRGVRAGRRWWAMRPVLLPADRPAVTATSTTPTLADLMPKQEANVR
ncbi:hypothetical protein ABZ738_05385 [Micromonospora sp. NPDC047793]|uniref:hypothetical protein n=1 Tax=Micromonospora sp. NPDC047793 TaxID=3154342 RepID=UPI0033F57C91